MQTNLFSYTTIFKILSDPSLLSLVIGNIQLGSLHVMLTCFTDERFLEVWTDYESGRIKERLQREFTESGIQLEGFTVGIKNLEEVNRTKIDIERR